MKKHFLITTLACGSLLLNGCGAGNAGGGGGNGGGGGSTAARLSITAAATYITAGTPLKFAVTALDSSGAVVSGYSGTVHFSSSDPIADLPADSKLSSGTGSFSVKLKTAGGQNVSATDTVNSGITGSTLISVNPGPVSSLSVIPAAGAATIGIPISLTVNGVDAYGNPAAGTERLTSTDPQASFEPSSSLTLASGTGSVSVTFNNAGSQTVTATDTTTASVKGTSGPVNVVTNAATQLVFLNAPGGVSTRAPFSFSLNAVDAAGHVATAYNGTVHFSSNTDKAPYLPVDTMLAAGISPNLSATLETVGTQTITATDTSTTSLSGSTSINVSKVPDLAILSDQPPDGTVGVNYGPSKTEYFVCRFTYNRGPHWDCDTHPCDPVAGTCGSHPPCNFGNPRNSPCIEKLVVFLGFTFQANGGVPPYNWSASGLPPGLIVNPTNGRILGTPTSSASYKITVTVMDSGLPPLPMPPSASYTIKINDQQLAVNITPPPPPGVIKQPYNYTFTASGYPPFTWSESGQLPNGLALNSTTGVLSGTPTVANSFLIAVTAKDQFGQHSTQDFTIVVSTHGFQATGCMTTARDQQAATLLNNGEVLVTGGAGSDGLALATAEIFDPAKGTFATTGSMQAARSQHTATLLNDGRVFLVGGITGPQGTILGTTELYDLTGTTSTAGNNLQTARYGHTATLLGNGMVLFTGGASISEAALASAELFDPVTGNFSTTGSMVSARIGHTATLLANGKVLVTGGMDASSKHLDTAELYDPASGSFIQITPTLIVTRAFHTATLLPAGAGANAGKVLLAGGIDDNNAALNTAELYDPLNESFTGTSNMVTAHASHTATLLNNGTVLIAGGADSTRVSEDGVELFDPSNATFSATGSLISARSQHTATFLNSNGGEVLVIGGLDPNRNAIAGAELYQ